MSYHQAIESIRDHAIIMLDTDGVITGWSAGAEAVMGFGRDEMLGRDAEVIFVEEDRATNQPEREMAQAAATGTALDERWHLRKNGGRFWASGTLNALRDEAGGLIGFVKILRDQTAQKELNEKLEQARASAEQANRSKDHFIAMVSHELRTPLSIILMWSKMLQQNDLDGEDVQEAVDAIERSAEAQSRLIEDLLDRSRIAAGKLSLEIAPADMGEIVTRLIDSFRPAMEAKGIECVADIDGRAGMIECDGDRMQQVVRNLVSNAVKFTPDGGRIGVGLRREGEFVELSVTDSGVGIEPSFLPKVFERFSQGDSARDRPHGGLGLGLSIVQSIVEMHGGEVVPFSRGPGTGACFTVRLPVHPADAVPGERS